MHLPPHLSPSAVVATSLPRRRAGPLALVRDGEPPPLPPAPPAALCAALAGAVSAAEEPGYPRGVRRMPACFPGFRAFLVTGSAGELVALTFVPARLDTAETHDVIVRWLNEHADPDGARRGRTG